MLIILIKSPDQYWKNIFGYSPDAMNVAKNTKKNHGVAHIIAKGHLPSANTLIATLEHNLSEYVINAL